jgi:hypothetical protein
MRSRPQHFLYFSPLPQVQGSFLPGFVFTFTFLWYFVPHRLHL